MIEITSPDALGIQRVKINGIVRYSVVPMRMRAAAQTYYGQEFEYAVYPAKGCGNSYHLDPAKALGRAVDDAVKFYG
jgi:hypothetical protein